MRGKYRVRNDIIRGYFFNEPCERKKEGKEGREKEREKNRWRSSGSRLIRLRGELETSETGRVKFTRENSGQSQIYPRSNIRFSAFRLFRSYRALVSNKKT